MPRSHRRVVITGIGLLTPVGSNTADTWSGILAGRSGIGPITRFDSTSLPTTIAAEVHGFDPAVYLPAKDIKKADLFCQFALAAASMAVADARLPIADGGDEEVGAIVGSAMGGVSTIEDAIPVFLRAGVRKISPFFVPRILANIAAGQIAMRYGLLGVNYCTTSACASGAHAIGEAFRLIRDGYQRAMIAGGSEAAITPMSLAGFGALRALSTRNDDPAAACRPFDRDRDGLVIGEGAGIVVMETLESAESRGATIYAEVIGYGANADAYHITAPAPDGAGAARCMSLALRDAEIAPGDVGYINAHGTSTSFNDASETAAIKRTFGSHAYRLAVSSTKSMTGHTFGAAGGIEAALSALALRDQILPPTLNCDSPDPECDLDYVAGKARKAAFEVALSNSFGFGGANACLAMRRYHGGSGAL